MWRADFEIVPKADIGASLSGLAAGEIVDQFGYSAAFLTSGAAALVALVVFALWMPETADRDISVTANSARRGRWRRAAAWIGAVVVFGALTCLIAYVSWKIDPERVRMAALTVRRFTPEAAAIAIFAVTYLVVAIGRLPGFWLDRAGAALIGASLMVAVGVLPLEEATKAIEFNTCFWA